MKPSKELFHLIKSLTKSEKRYFKLTSALQQGEKNYIKLFDAIESRSDYNEEVIRSMFRGTTIIRHLPSEKNHLFNLILKSLRNFHADKSVSAQLQEMVENIEILYDKALYGECNKIIRKAKKIAQDNEQFYFLLELIDWERIMSEEGYTKGKQGRNTDLMVKEEEEVLEKLRNLAEYQILYSKINYVFRKGGFTRDEKERKIVNDIMTHHLIKGKNTALSVKASSICYYIQGLCAWTNRDMEKAFLNFEKVMVLFKQNPPLITEFPKRYTRVLYHQLLYYIDKGKFEAFFSSLDHLKKLSGDPAFSSIDLQIRVFTLATISELMACQALKDFATGNKVVEEILAGLEKYKFKISKEDYILYYYNISKHYFNSGDLKKSLEFINKVLNDSEANLRQDLFVYSRLLNLTIHFELGNIDLLDYIISSTSRFIKKIHRDYEYENAILRNMKKLQRAILGHRDIRPVLVEFKEEINSIFRNPSQKITMEYYDILSWIDLKQKSKRLQERYVA